MIRSFDIFDTCLTRRVAEPSAVFDAMARRLGLGGDFRLLRQEAEREAARRHGEATLAEIYDILGVWSGWNATRREELMSEELAEERRQLVAVPEVLRMVETLRTQGARIAFLSDMYLPSSFLIERLRHYGIYQDNDLLLVSCEHRKSKTSGQLYQLASEILGKSSWVHTGNHLIADVDAAKRAGLIPNFFSRANLTLHETRLQNWAREGGRIGSAWAASAREARISHSSLTDHEHAIASVAAGVAAPLLLAYVSWIYERATRLGVDRLYFLARDGQILREIFSRIAKAKGSTIEARYLYASRIALRFPRKFPMSDSDAAGIFQASGALPIDVVALRLGLTVGELLALLPEHCISRGKVAKDKVKACQIALESPKACEMLNQVACSRAERLEAYLRQEGVMAPGSVGFVDLGWAGSLQIGVQRALLGAGHPGNPPWFYMGLARHPSSTLTAEAFAFDCRKDSVADIPWFVILTELFAQANHGSTLGFERNQSGTLRPCLDALDGDNPLIPGWLDLHQRTILGFTESVIANQDLPVAPAALVRLLRGHLKGFWFFPSRLEAAAWGACRFSSHGSAATREPLVAFPRSLRDLAWLLGVRYFGAGTSAWPYGAAAQLPRPLDSLARFCHRVRFKFRPLQW